MPERIQLYKIQQNITHLNTLIDGPIAFGAILLIH